MNLAIMTPTSLTDKCPPCEGWSPDWFLFMRQDWEAGGGQAAGSCYFIRSELLRSQSKYPTFIVSKYCEDCSVPSIAIRPDGAGRPGTRHYTLFLQRPANLICGHPANDLIDLLRPTFLAQLPGLVGVSLTMVDTEHYWDWMMRINSWEDQSWSCDGSEREMMV